MKDKMIILFALFTLSVTVNAQGESASTYIENLPKVDLTKDSLKVLHIGNSFTENSTAYLSNMVQRAGVNTRDMCLYKCNRGGGSFSTFIDCWNDNDVKGYNVSKILGGITLPIASSATPNDGSNIRKVFTDCKWDVIIIQQVSNYSHKYEFWNQNHAGGHLPELIDLIRTYQPQAAIGINMVHAAYNYNSNTNNLYQLIADSYHQFCIDYGVDFIIPYGTAVQNIRQSSINTTEYGFSNDKLHLAPGIGQYVACAAYFETLIAPRYGVSIMGNPYRVSITDSQRNSATYPDEFVSVTDENAYLCQKAAVIAVHDMFNINNPDNTSILTDGETYTNGSLLNNQKIFYTRTFNNTKWQSLYIPFSMGYDDWKDEFDVAYINGIRQIDTNNDNIIDKTIMDIEKIEEGSLMPNLPYLIKAKTIGKKTITVNDVSLYPAGENSIDCSTTIAKYTFTGTYRTIPASVLLENEYYAMGGGAIIMTDGVSNLKPYRWYVKAEARSPMYNTTHAAKTFTIEVDDDVEENNTTGISCVSQNKRETNIVHDLNGRVVNEKALTHGIYIKNGKKIVIQ
jgi:hypothetical protein